MIEMRVFDQIHISIAKIAAPPCVYRKLGDSYFYCKV